MPLPSHRKSFIQTSELKPYIDYLESHLSKPPPRPDTECAFCAIADALQRLAEERDALQEQITTMLAVSQAKTRPSMSHDHDTSQAELRMLAQMTQPRPTYPDKCPHCSGVWHSTATQWPFPLKVNYFYHHEQHCPTYSPPDPMVQDEEGDDVS